ncbi:MAG TPA: hypothetical protein VK698_01090 [Kofleriaceae bacterium]|nr:hypothetical protein [Kofleriaceae bacterium]
MRLPVVCLFACALAALAAAPAPAHAGDEQGAIAVLPFTSPEKRLEIYGVPVSRALTSELRGAAGAPVHAVSDPSSLPRRIAWVIDGRILARGGGKVVLEARLRDPDRGNAAGQVATRPRPLRQIDQLARDLARQLLPVLAGAESARAQRAASAAERRARTAAEAASHRPAPAPRGRGAAPVLLVGRTGGGVASAGLDADPIVTATATELAGRLGRRPVVVELGGIATPGAVKAALAGARASHALLSEVREVQFSWLGVLTARGRVRVVLVDAAGSALFDSTIETDTLVGSRGDRHEALLGFVARQAMEIAAPRLRKVLAR